MWMLILDAALLKGPKYRLVQRTIKSIWLLQSEKSVPSNFHLKKKNQKRKLAEI